jgi:hypothetical protein
MAQGAPRGLNPPSSLFYIKKFPRTSSSAFLHLSFLLSAYSTQPSITSATCVTYTDQVAAASFPSHHLPSASMVLGGNFYGAGGRITTLRECTIADAAPHSSFGFNWTRGSTATACSAASCKAPACFHDFSLLAAGYGITPWGSTTGPNTTLPVSMDEIKSLLVTHNISFSYTDLAPGVDPPATSKTDSRRVRFIVGSSSVSDSSSIT